MKKPISLTTIQKGLTYSEYLELTGKMLDQGKTTCSIDTPSLVDYTRLNMHRMERLDKTINLEPETIDKLNAVSRPLYWVLITEAWCGDAAQNLPVIAKMAGVSERIELKILLRDENPELMDRYRTNGGRAIPKLICLDQVELKELWHWGPRPHPAQEIMNEHKTDPVGPREVVMKNIQLWYAKDKGKTIQKEILQLINRQQIPTGSGLVL